MRIGIDCRLVLEKPTGIGSYIIGLVRDLLRVDAEDDFVLVVRRSVRPELREVISRPVEIVRCPLPHMGISQKLLAHRYVRPLRLDVFHHPHHDLPWGLAERSVVTIHHLPSFRLSTGPSSFRRALLVASAAWSVRRASKVIAVSNYTASLIRQRYGIAEKVEAIYPPPSPVLAHPEDEQPLPPGLRQGRYFLCVAERRPHKNIAGLIWAYALVRGKLPEEWHLVIAGAPYRNYREPERATHQLGVTDSVHFLGDVPTPLLWTLYRKAGAFVLVSLLENFGYPVVEAMRFGLPVVCSDTGSLPEVAADAALLVDPRDQVAIADALLEVATNQDRRRQLRTAALRRFPRFAGLDSAQRTLEIYRQVASTAT